MRMDIKQECAGKWSSVLNHIGIEASVFNGKHQPCIFCGGRDRARWDRAKEFYFCGGCGAKQPIELAMEFLGTTFKETTQIIRPDLGKAKMTTITAPDKEANLARLKKVHAGLKHITPDTAAFLYLAKRGINILPDANCYAHPGLDYWETTGDKPVKVGTFPAMVSVFKDGFGELVSYHITYLNVDGTKAHVSSVKKIFPGVLPMAGASIQLFKRDEILAIAEGVETALAVTKTTDVPCWAAGNAGLMEKIEIPESVKKVVIYADSDTNFIGQQAAYNLAARLKSKGFDVTVTLFIDCEQVQDRGVKCDALDYAIANS